MKKRIFWLCLPLALGQASYSYAQNAVDALRYSQLQFGGSARTLGIGGANVALGADYGSVSSNPAGLGLYQKSEIQLSPGIGIGQGEGQLLNGSSPSGGPLSQSANSFHLSGGAVFSGRANRRNSDSNWKGGAFAIGFTRIADFNAGSNYSGTVNDRNSLVQRLRQYTGPLTGYNNGSLVDQSQNGYTNLDGLAFGTYLTDTLKNRQGQYGLVYQRRGSPITQGERVVNSGSMSQFDLAYGGSYRDKLYIGLGLGVVTSNFHSRRTFGESDADTSTPLNNYSLYDDLQTSGTGLNVRLGLIYRATDAVRIGASVQTPTWMRMTDTYSSTLNTYFDATQGFAAEQYTASTNTTQYAYNITTPFRANGGVAVTIGKYGFLTGDIEYLGYQQARLDSNPSNALGDNYDFAYENSTIKQQYTNAVNLRFGGEARLDIFRVRLGYARYGSPYNSGYASTTATGLAQNYYTAGLGLRQGNFFLDVAGVYTTFNTYYSPYSLNDGSQPVIKVDNTRFTSTLTAGFTF